MAVNTAFPSRRNSRSVSVLPYVYYAYAADTAAALLTTDFLFDAISDIRFQTVSTGGETIKIQGSTNGADYDDLTPSIETTGMIVASVDLASGSYVLPLHKFGHYKKFKFVKSAATEAGTAIFVVARPWNKPAP